MTDRAPCAPLVVGQVGCGYWGPNLARNIIESADAELRWVAEASAERRAYVEGSFPGVQATPRWEDMLEDESVDAVVVATPASTHFTLARQALEARKHVFVEKPLATAVGQCRTLQDLSAATGKTLMVGHTFLFNPAFEVVKDTAAQKSFGELHHVYTQRLNLGQVRSDVDVFWNLAPHDISMALALADGVLPESVSCRGVAFLQNGLADVAFADLRWASGLLCHIHVSWLDPGRTRRLTVVGTREMLVYDDVREPKVTLYDRGVELAPRLGDRMDFDSSRASEIVYRAGPATPLTVPDGEPLQLELAHFFECIRSGRQPRSDVRNGLDVVAVLEAASRSLADGGQPYAIADVVA